MLCSGTTPAKFNRDLRSKNPTEKKPRAEYCIKDRNAVKMHKRQKNAKVLLQEFAGKKLTSCNKLEQSNTLNKMADKGKVVVS